MNKYIFIMSPLLFFATTGIAACIPDSSQCMNTTLGLLEQKTNYDSGDGYSYLTLNCKEIYKEKADYMVVSMEHADYLLKGKEYLISRTTISYVSEDPCFPDKPGAPCSINVILDLTSGKPVLSNKFFSETIPSLIAWVSWGKANAIIVTDDGLKFKYSNGHVERVTKVNDAAGDGSKDK